MNDLPARIDRAAFERVLQRATEIQSHGRDVGDTLTEEEVLALGREVGIPEMHLRQALLEEQTRTITSEADGWLDRAVGPDTVVAERVVQGTRESIAAALGGWFEKHEILTIQRATPGKVSWERLSSMAGAMRRIGAAFDARRGRPFLDKVQLVTAVLTPLEDGYCHVTLVASLRSTRTGYLAGGGVIGLVGTTGGLIATLMGAPELALPAFALPSLGGGWLIARAFRPIAERARLGLLRALDQLERQPALPKPATPVPPKGRALARDLGDVVREITREVRKAMEEK